MPHTCKVEGSDFAIDSEYISSAQFKHWGGFSVNFGIKNPWMTITHGIFGNKKHTMNHRVYTYLFYIVDGCLFGERNDKKTFIEGRTDASTVCYAFSQYSVIKGSPHKHWKNLL